jgi:hypothetical protein
MNVSLPKQIFHVQFIPGAAGTMQFLFPHGEKGIFSFPKGRKEEERHSGRRERKKPV